MILYQELIAIIFYASILVGIALISFKGHQNSSDFILGSRSLNFWVTALAAHASDMSSWLFMAFPAVIFSKGLISAWLAVGLSLFMFLNWFFIAPRVRLQTEEYNSYTFSSFFESRFADTSGMIRIFTGLMSCIFYTIYISAGIVSLGLLIESLFGINYSIGITIGVLLVIPYLFFGGYITLAWLDLFQGLFLLLAIVIVPIVVLRHIDGFEEIKKAFDLKNLSFSMIPSFNRATFVEIFLLTCSWGLGYFGQPHIITKFMGIKKIKEMRKSMAVGMTWQVIVLSAATAIGVVSVPFFTEGIQNPELIFPTIVNALFSPFLAAFILCAVLAATISTMDSQILVLASTLTEDFYKRIFRKTASSKELLWISRFFVLIVALISYLIAFFKVSTIYSLVLFSWSGLGAAFGPLLIFALFFKKTNKYGAWAGILIGGMTTILWPYLSDLSVYIPRLIPGFILSSLAIYFISSVTAKKESLL